MVSACQHTALELQTHPKYLCKLCLRINGLAHHAHHLASTYSTQALRSKVFVLSSADLLQITGRTIGRIA
eukprot:1205744-Amphidinium_carterae.1